MNSSDGLKEHVSKMSDVEKVARLIAPSRWSVMDRYRKDAERKYAGQNVMWPVDQFQDNESMRTAMAIVDLFDTTLAERDARITQLEAEVERLAGEAAEVRRERDALLKKPLDFAKMDSIDDDKDVGNLMVAYYWWQQAQEARAALHGDRG